MTSLSARAKGHLDKLRLFYEAKNRPEATQNLTAAVERAALRIETDSLDSLAAPQPYPSLAHAGERWIKEGPYWFVFAGPPDPVILGIYFGRHPEPHLMDIPALILAGGEATRMGGGDKPLRTLAGQTLLARIAATLAPGHTHIALSANGDPARFGTRLPVLPDPVPGQGPLGGVLAGLEWAASLGAGTLLTVPGDTPLIPPGLAAALGAAPAVAESGGRRHHLVALWPVACAPALRAWLGGPGSRSVRAFGATLPMRGVPFAGDPFANVNTPEDLAALEARLAHGRSGTDGSPAGT